MKSILTSITLFFLSVVSFAQVVSLEIMILPIIQPKEAIIAHFDGSRLTIAKGDQKATPVPIAKENAEKIRKAIHAIPLEQWKGFWASLDYLDGYKIVGNLVIDGQKHQFQGMNGCPPKFTNILSSFNEVAKNPHFQGWEEMEKAAKQYESFDAFKKSIIPDRKNE